MPKALTDQERQQISAGLKAAALEMAGRQGIRKTTVDELVKRVNIPKGTFYLFYKSKEELIFEALEAVHDKLQSKLVEALQALENDLTEEKAVAAFAGLIQMVDESQLAQFIARGDFELLVRKLPEAAVQAHFVKDGDAISQLLPLFPAAERIDQQALEGAFRGLFLLLLHKREMGEEHFDASLTLLLTGLVKQLFAA